MWRIDAPFEEGRNLTLCGKDVEFDRPVDKQDFLSGVCFGRGAASTSIQAPPLSTTAIKKKFVTPTMSTTVSASAGVRSARTALQDINPGLGDRQAEVDTGNKKEDSHWTANWY